jgi:hypothetical protein
MSDVEPEFLCRLAGMASTPVEVVREWLGRSDEFRGMLKEYARCQERAMELCSLLSQDRERVAEFEDLVRQLEAEMLQFLRENSGTNTET